MSDGSHLFSQQHSGKILWNSHTIESPVTKVCIRLSKLAEKKRWNPDTDIDWTSDTIREQFPCQKTADPLAGFSEYEKLPLNKKLQLSWQRHGMEISEILHGEQLAMLCASQLITLMPCMESRLFASRQAADEARHIEFFKTYMNTLDLTIHQPSPAIKALSIEALESPQWEVKLLICQILIESLAMAQFSHLSHTSLVPALRQGLRRIMDDEARHVRFGSDYLADWFRHHNSEQSGYYGQYLVDQALKLASSDNLSVAIGKPLGWDTGELRRHLRQHRVNNPTFIHQRFRQLSINIKAIGMMDNKLAQRLQRFSGR